MFFCCRRCNAGPVGKTGTVGVDGKTGPAGVNTGGVVANFASDQSIGDNDFMSQSSASSVFIKNSIVILYDITLTSIIFNSRKSTGLTIAATATLFAAPLNSISGIVTSLSATIPIGDFFAVGSGSVSLVQGQLISIQITTGGGAFSNGATVAVL